MLTGVFGEHHPEHSANCKRSLSKLESSSSDLVIFVSWFKPFDLFFFFFFFLVFQDRVSLCSPGCPGTHFVDQAGLGLRNPPASAS